MWEHGKEMRATGILEEHRAKNRKKEQKGEKHLGTSCRRMGGDRGKNQNPVD